MRAICACLALVAWVACPAVARAAPHDPRLRNIHTWAFAIGDGDLRGDVVRRYAGYDMVVLDGQEVSAAAVASLRAAGKVVLGYLDVGTIEPGRPWYRWLKRYRLDYWPQWGEWYARVDAPGFRRAVAGRIAPAMLRKGLDGLFLDNTDMIETHRSQRSGMQELVRALARLAHGRRRLLFAQNGEDVIGPTLRYYDGWNREDVSATYSHGRYVRQPGSEIAQASRALERFAARGLLVLATDYVAAHDPATSRFALRNACSAGAVPFQSDIDLTRVPQPPLRCP